MCVWASTMKSLPGLRLTLISLAAAGSYASAGVTSKKRMPVMLLTASMAAGRAEAEARKVRRDSPALVALASRCSLMRGPRCPPRKNRVPCSSGVRGPSDVRSKPLKCSNTLNSMCVLLNPSARTPTPRRPGARRSWCPGRCRAVPASAGRRRPAGLHSHVLHSVDCERARDAGDPGVRLVLPERRPRLGVERAEVAIVGATEEDQPAAGGEDRSPVLIRELVGPHPLAGGHVPRLQLADMRGALPPAHRRFRPIDAEEELAGLVGSRLADERAAQVLVGGDVEVVRLRVVARRRPVFAAPEPGTERDGGAAARLALRVVARAAAHRIDLGEHLLGDERLRVHEPDAVGTALEPPQIAVAARVHEALDERSEERRV